MQVERLRLAGFKSFVEPTELAIEPGLTGIVGPNGCGKSNLVEALRWVMGEGSARRLRGGEMDDVIFSGSGGRPARNLAEVALTLDNSARDAPFAHNETTTVEVVRRIERGGGSSYRINGREVRARDVQLLFADASTGAHSGALVSQGRVGELIAAKPAERRLLLDEAAGTAGLHARRHEAELKLQAAEANLARADDVIATLAAQMETLRKQARQAQRYRRLGEQIRRAEAHLLAARWQGAAAEAERLAAELRAAERAVAAATEEALGGERVRAAAEAELPDLRLAQAAAAAALQRLTHAREALEQELARNVAARAEAERRLEQVLADRQRETELLADADAALSRLAAERQALEHGKAAAEAAHAHAAAQLAEAETAVATAETGLQQMTEACATGEARRAALARPRRDPVERRNRLEVRLAEAEQQRVPLLDAIVSPAAIKETAAAVAEAASQVDACRIAAAAAAEALIARQEREAAAIDRAREAERGLARLNAEAEALSRILTTPAASAEAGPPVLSLLNVPEGFEAAVAALFDGELALPLLPAGTESTSETAGGWIELGPLAQPAALPEGAEPFAAEIGAPPALARHLSMAGLVASEGEGWRLQSSLQPGQSLVDREGRLWRWDGFARLAPASQATAEQLRQRNRLAALTGEIETSTAISRRAAEAATVARTEREAAAAAEREAAAALRAAEAGLAEARTAETELARHGLAAEARLAALTETIDKLRGEIAETTSELSAAERALVLSPAPELARTALEAARAEAAAARRHEAEARAALDRIERADEAKRMRLGAIGGEEELWRKRRDRAVSQTAILEDRRNAIATELDELAARPAAIAAETGALAEASANAGGQHRDAADALAAGETRLREAAEAARHAQQALAESRERRARLEAQRDGAAETLQRLRDEIGGRLGHAPEDIVALTDGTEAAAGELGDLAARLDRLLRERDGMGPVNLIAEQEAAEVETRLAGLQHERADLTAAIARLRHGIGTLDHEARRRLIAAFERLNDHFAELFARLFGGGKAELAWVGEGDPLDCGLDIVASPPGKRLQSLTLLSGGEQALTAIALIFAMFLTNPAPVCVLDEVDAPLDDANVDRFCRLVAETADTTGTRFLLITHHRITMARMDRLFGVTMAERGVSQLVSVDLARAAELRQTA